MLRGLRAAPLLGAVLTAAHRPGRPSEGMRGKPPGYVPRAAITGAARARHEAMLARVAAGRKHCPRCCPPGESLPGQRKAPARGARLVFRAGLGAVNRKKD